MELLEYAYMLHKRLFEEAVSHSTSYAVIQARRELAFLDNRMNQVSHFLEVQNCCETAGLPWEFPNFKRK